jgi:predicted DNA-binding transcriptional regulator AlpA
MHSNDPERLLTECELAELWKVTPDCLQKMRHEGRGPRYVRIGRLVRYRMSDVIRYIEENCVGTKSRCPSSLGVVQ